MNKPKTWSPEELEQLRSLRDGGKSFGEISAIMNVSKNSALCAYHRKILGSRFPSDHKKDDNGLDEVARFKPSLPMIPGLSSSEKYNLVRFEHD